MRGHYESLLSATFDRFDKITEHIDALRSWLRRQGTLQAQSSSAWLSGFYDFAQRMRLVDTNPAAGTASVAACPTCLRC